MEIKMPWLLLVILVAAIASGVYKCSPERKSRLQQTFETPKRVEEDILRHLDEGMKRNRRALEEQEPK
jgi:predicted polyphosphate/ATP-dependent NAD kinase